MSDTESIDAEIKRLERDKKAEELRQLKSGWMKWATPATMLALLPFLVGFGAWALSEFRLYSNQEVFRQLDREKQSLMGEKADLEAAKLGLNVEIQTLILTKQDYRDEAERAEARLESLQALVDKRQAQVDANYLKARFARDAADYALSHIDVGQAQEKLDEFRRAVDGMPSDLAASLRDVVRDYELAVDMIDASTDMLVMSHEALDLLPASDWARNFQSRPSGYFINGRQIMIADPGPDAIYYDVDRDRLLSDEEARDLPRS